MDNVNSRFNEKLNVNESRNMENVVSWFKAIKNKNSYKFLIFDTKDLIH